MIMKIEELLSIYGDGICMRHNMDHSRMTKPLSSADFHKARGAQHEAQELHDQAIDEYKEAVRLDPNDAQTRKRLGELYAKKGLLYYAIFAYNRAIRLNPDDADAYYALGMAYIERGMVDEAIQEWQEVVRISPDHPVVYHELGNAYAYQGQYREALDAYRSYLRYAPAAKNVERIRARVRDLEERIEQRGRMNTEG